VAFEIKEEWYPMPLQLGPPLPRSMQIYWPWVTPPEVPPEAPIYACPHCPAEFATQEELFAHIRTAHAGQPPQIIYTCPYCGARFESISEWQEHYQKFHAPPEEIPEVPVVPPEEVPEVPVVPPEEVPEVPVVPPKAVPDIKIESLTIQPKEIPVGEPVTVSVIARNYGNAPGAKTVTCKVNGMISTETVTIGAGERKPLLFKVVPLEVKSYRVSVNGLIGTFKATAPELDLGEIVITGINGRPFKSARGGIGVLAEPITVSSLRGATVNWRNKSVDFDDRLVGILFFMTYEGVHMTFPCEDGPGYRGIFLAGARRGTFEASTLINRDWAGGNWCPGIYQGHFMWRELYRDEDYRGGGDFMVSHFKCTGKGSYEPSPEIYPLV